MKALDPVGIIVLLFNQFEVLLMYNSGLKHVLGFVALEYLGRGIVSVRHRLEI